MAVVRAYHPGRPASPPKRSSARRGPAKFPKDSALKGTTGVPKLLPSIAGAVILLIAAAAPALAASPPDFAPNPSVGWVARPGQYLPPPSGPGPVPQLGGGHGSPNAEFLAKGTQPTFPMGD